MVSGIHDHVLLSLPWAEKTCTFLQLWVWMQAVLCTYTAHRTARKGGLGIQSDISRQNKMTEGKGSCCHIESGLNCGIWKLHKRCYTLLAWTLDTEVERESLCLVISPCFVAG